MSGFMSKVKFFFEAGIDVIVYFALMFYFQSFPELVMIFFMLIIIRMFFVKNFIMMMGLNFILISVTLIIITSVLITGAIQIIYVGLLVVFFVIIVTIQMGIIAYKVFNYKSELIGDISSKRFILRVLLYLLKGLDSILNAGLTMVALLYPLILSLFIIVAYAGLYNAINVASAESNVQNNGVYEVDDNQVSVLLESNHMEYSSISGLLENIETLHEDKYIHFSAATYFTIGYGDITIKGQEGQFIVLTEMLLSHLITVMFFALYGSLFYDLSLIHI